MVGFFFRRHGEPEVPVAGGVVFRRDNLNVERDLGPVEQLLERRLDLGRRRVLDGFLGEQELRDQGENADQKQKGFLNR